MRHIHWLFVALIFILAACSDAATSQNTVEPALALEQVYEGAMVDGSAVSIHYPADWGIQVTVPDFGVAFTFPEDLVGSLAAGSTGTFEAGQIQVFVIFSAKAQLAGTLENVSAVGILESFMANVDSSAGKVGTIESKTIEGHEAASILLSEKTGDSYAVVIDAGDAYAVVTGTFASGALAKYQTTIEAIASSASHKSVETSG